MRRFAAPHFVRFVLASISLALPCLGFSQDFTQVYQNAVDTTATASATQAFDQTGHVAWARVASGKVTSIQTALDSKGTVTYQDLAAGTQITGLHSLDDGGVIIAATTQNSAKQDLTTLYSWSADGTVFRSVALPGLARTALDPAGFVVALVKPLTGTKATLIRFDTLLIRDWSLSINADLSQSFDGYQLVVDSSGNPYPMVPINATTKRAFKYNPQGSISQAWGPDSNGGLGFRDFPNLLIKGVVCGQNGSLYVLTNTTSGNAYSVVKLDKDGLVARKPNGTDWVYALPTGASFSQLATNESGDVTVVDNSNSEVFRLNIADASVLRMTSAFGRGIVDASDPRFLYRLHITGTAMTLEKHDWVLGVKSWSKVFEQTSQESITSINDLEVDRGGNIAISFVKRVDLPRVTKYSSVLIVLDQTRIPRRQSNVRDGLFAAKNRSVYSPTINDLDYDWNPLNYSNMDSPYEFRIGKTWGLKFKVNLGFTSFTVDLGQFGGFIKGKFAGKIDLRSNLHMSLGSFNVNYPISFKADAPPESDPSMLAGSTNVKVNFSYAPSATATLSTNPISVKPSLGVDVAYSKTSDLSAIAFSEVIFSMSLEQLALLLLPTPVKLPAVMPNQFQLHFPLFGQELVTNNYLGFNQYEDAYVKAIIQLPLFRTNGRIKDVKNQDYTISSSGSSLFFDIKGYFTGFFPYLEGLNEAYIAQGEGKGENWEAELYLRWLQITGHTTETFRQRFNFNPGGPVVYFLDENGVRVKPAEYPLNGEVPLSKLGNTLTFTMPASAVLRLNPVVTLPGARFSNATYLDTTPAVGFSYFSGSAGVSYRGIEVMGDSWDFFVEAPIKIAAKIAEPEFGVNDLGSC